MKHGIINVESELLKLNILHNYKTKASFGVKDDTGVGAFLDVKGDTHQTQLRNSRPQPL